MNPEDFTSITPYGLVVGAHVTPIDHLYFAPLPGSPRDAAEVRAIADGVIFALQPRDINVDQNVARAREWRIDIAHTCTFTSYLDLLTSITPELEAAWNHARTTRTPISIPVQAGQVLGRIGAQTLDFGAYDYEITLPGFITPSNYDRERWKVHTIDPFPHFDEPTQTMLRSRFLRTVEPLAGKIDHDIDGRLIGNWFAVGTNGYAGDGRWDYWEGHLAIVPNHLDPTRIMFSTGNWTGQARQFGITSPTPHPTNVTVETGPTAYELAPVHYTARNRQAHGFGPNGIQPGDDIEAATTGAVQGVVLFQLLEAQLLKVEAFPGRTLADGVAFTASARMYER